MFRSALPLAPISDSLCDRIGIIVGGKMECIGSSKELKSRYGMSYRLTIQAPTESRDQMIS